MEKHHHLTLALVLLFLFAVSMYQMLEKFYTVNEPRPDRQVMLSARQLAKKWFDVLSEEKRARGIPFCTDSPIAYQALLGEEFSSITTSLGSLEAKEIATNPEFAALTVRLLHDAGIDSGDHVGVTISGSFPALALSVLAAVQTMHLQPLIFSSVGASNYGANQPNFAWPDIEKILQERRELQFASRLMTPGGDEDRTGGLFDSSLAEVKMICQRNDVTLFVPGSLQESIRTKLNILEAHKIHVLINIGGNQSCLGACAHGAVIPNGYHERIDICRDADRGLLMRCNERGIPILHFLNIKELAARYQMDLAPGRIMQEAPFLYQRRKIESFPVICSLILIILSLYFIRLKVVK